MNKELILKFKDEFDYWLNEGKVLLGNTVDGKINWCEYVSPFEVLKGITIPSEKELIVIINDKYVEFRKAIAEGKTIQCQNRFANDWLDIPGKVKFIGKVSDYRIKPDELKYKIGDWVVLHFSHLEDTDDCPTQIRGIKDGVYYNDAECTSPVEEGEDWYIVGYWKPKRGDRCYFYNKGIKHLGTYIDYDGIFHIGDIQGYYRTVFKNCEPAQNTVQFNKCEERPYKEGIRCNDVCWFISVNGGIRVAKVLAVEEHHYIFNNGVTVRKDYCYPFSGDIPLDVLEELDKENI